MERNGEVSIRHSIIMFSFIVHRESHRLMVLTVMPQTQNLTIFM